MMICSMGLKAKRSCASGYRWFARRFNSPAEYQSVIDALVADGRIEDACWLLDHFGSISAVLAIGDRARWGSRFGASALRESMKLAFFEMGAHCLVAKIHPANARSLSMFQRCGFHLDRRTPTLDTYVMSAQRYHLILRKSPWPGGSTLRITRIDKARLRSLLALEPALSNFELEHEVARALIVEPRHIPQDVITMNTRALLRVDRAEVEASLVYPHDVDELVGKWSVSSSIGTAILGCREGDAFDWRTSERTHHIKIAKVLYQPEAAGDFHL